MDTCLTVDVGNSGIKAGLFVGGRLVDTCRLPTPPDGLRAAWAREAAAVLEGRHLDHAGIASVVPAATDIVQELLHPLLGRPAVEVGPHLPLPFTLGYTTPETLGTDRLAAAAAVWCGYGGPAGTPRDVVALDAGTATTYEVIDRAGTYRGGAIGPGPHLVQHALSGGTAQLPETPLHLPETPIGRSTAEALQSGILYGFVDGVRGMLKRLEEALEAPPFVVATGGWAPFLAKQLPGIDAYDPHLVLRGIRVLVTLADPS